MCKKLEKIWNSLDRTILVNKRELVLGLTVCTLAGVVAGILLSPRKTVTIGSHNGNNNTGNSAGLTTSDEPEEASPDRETEE